MRNRTCLLSVNLMIQIGCTISTVLSLPVERKHFSQKKNYYCSLRISSLMIYQKKSSNKMITHINISIVIKQYINIIKEFRKHLELISTSFIQMILCDLLRK